MACNPKSLIKKEGDHWDYLLQNYEKDHFKNIYSGVLFQVRVLVKIQAGFTTSNPEKNNSWIICCRKQ